MKGVHKQIHKSIRKGKREKLLTEDKQITQEQNFIKLYLSLLLTRQHTIRIPTEEPWLEDCTPHGTVLTIQGWPAPFSCPGCVSKLPLRKAVIFQSVLFTQ